MPNRYDVATASDSFFFNDTATTEIYTLSLHDALPICAYVAELVALAPDLIVAHSTPVAAALKQATRTIPRSEEHTSELQSRLHLVCRLLLEKTIIIYPAPESRILH